MQDHCLLRRSSACRGRAAASQLHSAVPCCCLWQPPVAPVLLHQSCEDSGAQEQMHGSDSYIVSAEAAGRAP